MTSFKQNYAVQSSFMDRFDVVNFILLYIKKEEASESWEMHQAGEDHHCSIKVQVARRNMDA